MPPLNEGDLMFMPITDPAISLPQAIEITRKQNAAIRSVPEVAAVVAKISRADTSTDPAPINMTETVVNLKPEKQWRRGKTREGIIAENDSARRQTRQRAGILAQLRMSGPLQREGKLHVLRFRERADQRAAHAARRSGDGDANGSHADSLILPGSRRQTLVSILLPEGESTYHSAPKSLRPWPAVSPGFWSPA